MKIGKTVVMGALALGAFCEWCRAEPLTLPTVFSDHMIFQRDIDAPVWGKGTPGAKVTVTFADQTRTTTVGGDGRWRVDLKPLAASAEPRMLKVVSESAGGREQAEFQDVLVGEVWLCSGQSNMAFAMEKTENAASDIPKADHPAIRLYDTDRVSLDKPADRAGGKWAVCTPESVKPFSGVAYYFGRKLHEDLGVPVGLLVSAWGGSLIEPWIPPAGFDGIDSLSEIARQAGNLPALFDASGKRLIPNKTYRTLPGAAYNGMIAPHVPYAIRGVLWYQGEANRRDGRAYVDKSRALVNGWRKLWGYDFPFYFMQIAPYEYGKDDPQMLPAFWEAQAEVARVVPRSAMAVASDAAAVDNLHPPRKDIPGERLALLAEAHTYGKDVVSSGPVFQKLEKRGNEFVVSFDFAEGLATRDGGAPDWFEIAGVDGVFHKADARIEKTAVVLSAPGVPAPRAVRLGWHKTAVPNLVNGAGLPASAFRAGE